MGVSDGRESNAGREGMDVKVSAISSSDGFATTHYGNGHIHCQAPEEGMREQPIADLPWQVPRQAPHSQQAHFRDLSDLLDA
jgi:hypothetical protein